MTQTASRRSRTAARFLALGLSIMAGTLATGCSNEHTPSTRPTTGAPFMPPYVFNPVVQYPATADSPAPGGPRRGDCANISGTGTARTLEIVSCESGTAAYRVVQLADTPEHCIDDADNRYFHASAETRWTACLDINWNTINCDTLADDQVTAVDCKPSPGRAVVKPDSYITGGTELGLCPHKTGIPHSTRQFVVCTEELT
ncbi:hypothetical protein ACFXHA_41015 [Nocardia sp. NPDC059240]|uniref:LppU/SCO3897 family protein n=1 Tax=Nocardia sp. NPDC059240 TaxID=3346786 RepID=UPI003689A1FB